MTGNDWCLAVHGGVGDFTRATLSPEWDVGARNGLKRAVNAGAAILKAGGHATDAAQASVEVLEDDAHFNAGHGAVFSADGRNELDAAIMDGGTRRAGAITGVHRVRNPVALARAVMDLGPHVMLTGDGAESFAAQHGVTLVDPGYFHTEHAWATLLVHRSEPGRAFGREPKRGTVGAVARDAHGHLAAATSTGGITGKRWNRVGDSALIGAGTWADDRGCAVSCTGTGEVFIPGQRRRRDFRPRAVDEQ